MKQEKVRFWNSIVSRFGLIFAILILSAILVSGYLVYEQAAQVIVSHSQERIKHTSALARQNFYDVLNEVTNDIAILAESATVSRYVKSPTLDNGDDLASLFSVTLKNKKDYFQVRLISAEDKGTELLRFDKKGGRIIRTPDSLLQEKGKKGYFLNALKLDGGQFFFSEINLNQEFGVVSHPITPTLRAVGRIQDIEGQLKALVVINVDLTSYFNELDQLIAGDAKLFITNNYDEYLYASDKSKCFGRQLETGESLQNDFNLNTWQLIAAAPDFDFMQDKMGNRYLYHIEELRYASGYQVIYLVSFMRSEDLFASAENVRKSALSKVIMICVFLLLAVFVIVWLYSKRIAKVTMMIASYENSGEEQSILNENRKDEVGVLVRAFQGMRERIDRQMTDLKDALSREQAAIREKDEFLQNMSHELRTPLNAILGLVQLMYKNKPSKNQLPILDSMQRSASNLADLMYDVLDHQKLVEGKVEIRRSPQVLTELLNDIYSSYQYEALNKKLKFSIDIGDEIKGKRYLLDPLRFKQIVTNLVVNAIKYTREGEVKLTAAVVDGLLKISVSDTGIGIKEESLQKIRDRFYQEQGGTDRSDGFGLGLSIVKQLLRLFNGQLLIESVFQKGSVFTVELPVQPYEGAMELEVKDTGSRLPELQSKYKVLHIEDDPATALLISDILGLDKIELIQVNTLIKAKAVLASDEFDLILSDMRLDGEHLGPFLKKLIEGEQEAMMMLVSALEPDEMVGISPYYVQKPFDREQVLDMVYQLLGQSEWSKPQLDTIFSQYDHDRKKIDNYLKILISEFSSYLDRIQNVWQSKEQKEWEAIHHRLVTHIKSLSLDRLAAHWPEKLLELEEGDYHFIVNQILYCLTCFRCEARLNSIG
ncbi:ATP-binding response regulator [Reichenbachiella ulvae]|uniref:histidine kinase n=1 Tax=Reichenbachiella ulvae TaxID=2980104 RepID=A0ABT3CP79_9BACT|nr:ATP-binding protein [Reichenbachiella ulvae]MCV9385535.1 ATP-binding protein [Reichenbachiella ulvae]